MCHVLSTITSVISRTLYYSGTLSYCSINIDSCKILCSSKGTSVCLFKTNRLLLVIKLILLPQLINVIDYDVLACSFFSH